MKGKVRGLFILFEGIDRSGKSTQTKMLVNEFKRRGMEAKLMGFPNRSTEIGKSIAQYLGEGKNLNDETIHLLFSANRWENNEEMKKELMNGTNLVVDRYAYSGVAFSSAKGLDVGWCLGPDVGLLKPDIVFYMDINPEEASGRKDYGLESLPFSFKSKDSNAATNTASTNSANASVESSSIKESKIISSVYFAENFWSPQDRGVNVLLHKLKNAKQTSADIHNLISARAQLEEDYGKKLLKLSRASLGSEEINHMKNSLLTVRKEFEVTAKAHVNLGMSIRKDIVNPLTNLIAQQRQQRKTQVAIIEKSVKQRALLKQHLDKVRDKLRSDTKKFKEVEQQIYRTQGMADAKLKIKHDKLKLLVESGEAAITDFEEKTAQANYQWQGIWKTACDVFQILEEERMNSAKMFLFSLSNLLATVCVADDESMERIRVSLEEQSIEEDIKKFIEMFGTGKPDFDDSSIRMTEKSNNLELTNNEVEIESKKSIDKIPNTECDLAKQSIANISIEIDENIEKKDPVNPHTRYLGGITAAQIHQSNQENENNSATASQRRHVRNHSGTLQGSGPNTINKRHSVNDMYNISASTMNSQSAQGLNPINSIPASRPYTSTSNYTQTGQFGNYPRQQPSNNNNPQTMRTNIIEGDPRVSSSMSNYSLSNPRMDPAANMNRMYAPSPVMQNQPGSRATMINYSQKDQNIPPSNNGNRQQRTMSFQNEPKMMYSQNPMSRPNTTQYHSNNPPPNQTQPLNQRQSLSQLSNQYSQAEYGNTHQQQAHGTPRKMRMPSPNMANSGATTPNTRQNVGGIVVPDENKPVMMYVKALYDYDAEAPEELSLTENCVVSVHVTNIDGWWEGEITDPKTGVTKRGLFPSNYTEPLGY
ncbi:hypothetical protein BB559_000266 [Furculomyces boomerangus]|uniref:dTMP kinase n=1 Tax=Furculomyces boomerangus TaxID=61424 RepID=A0A2T9Z5S6_9FUNG|nr:hypothetical protein BB559_000266 [Furculomyces boomerangus]